MSHKIGQLMADLLQKVGADITDKQFAEILALQSELPKEIGDSLNGLMTESAAKNNISIKNHFIHSAYNPLDNEIHKRLDMFEISDDKKELVKGEKSTGKKQILFFDVLDEILKNKKASKDPDFQNFKQEIDELRKQLNLKDEEKKNLESQKNKELNDYILNSMIASEFGKYNWSENYPTDIREQLAGLSLNKELEKLGATLKLDEQKRPVIVKRENPELEYFDSSNKKVTFTELVPKIMASNKYLRVSDNTNTTQTFVASGQPAPTTQSKSVNKVLAALRNSQSDQA